MKDIKANLPKIKRAISRKLDKISQQEVVNESDDVPMALNVLKLLELAERGDFYGMVHLKILGVKCRNLKLAEMSFKLTEEMKDYLEE